MKQLIVNADDFGLTEQVSRGILDAHREGIVTSTTLMPNGVAFEPAVAMSRLAPRLGIGVHLNLTEGEAVSPALRIPTLVDSSGRLHLTPGRLLHALLSRRVSLADIETELRQQIAKVLRAGIAPTHLDGHKHVHVLPGVSEIVIRLAQEFAIASVRCPQEEAPPLPDLLRTGRHSRVAVAKQYAVGRAVSAFARRFKEMLVKTGLLFPAHFYGLTQTGFLDLRSIQDILDSLPEGISELMCHPGYADAQLLATGTRLLDEREIEIQALKAFEVRKLLAERGIRLGNYGLLGVAARSEDAA
jgi:chitin disaccharide deacetylase